MLTLQLNFFSNNSTARHFVNPVKAPFVLPYPDRSLNP